MRLGETADLSERHSAAEHRGQPESLEETLLHRRGERGGTEERYLGEAQGVRG